MARCCLPPERPFYLNIYELIGNRLVFRDASENADNDDGVDGSFPIKTISRHSLDGTGFTRGQSADRGGPLRLPQMMMIFHKCQP